MQKRMGNKTRKMRQKIQKKRRGDQMLRWYIAQIGQGDIRACNSSRIEKKVDFCYQRQHLRNMMMCSFE